MAIFKLATAEKIIATAIDEARRRKLAPLALAVLDAGGHLVAFKREDGASFARFDIAYGKAWGALGMGFGTSELVTRADKYPTFILAVAAATNGRLIPSPGGVLICDESDEIVGAVGISGDSGDKDEACAVAGIGKAGMRAVTGIKKVARKK
jgi:uncharacterized protein GlcG (DUF336 family)